MLHILEALSQALPLGGALRMSEATALGGFFAFLVAQFVSITREALA